MSTQILEQGETQNEKRDMQNEKRFHSDLAPLSNWEPKPVEWLWKPYVPGAMLTLLSGAPGVGKTYVALAIA
ncbi:MAG: AAA family ATPase, partial [Terriglobales bacterium]